jgi:hypothetical protein
MRDALIEFGAVTNLRNWLIAPAPARLADGDGACHSPISPNVSSLVIDFTVKPRAP